MRSCYIFVAKAARRRGGQPRPAPMQGRSPTARLRPGLACKGGRHRSRGQHPTGAAPACMVGCGQPTGAAATYGHTCLQRGAHKGGPAAWRPQGAVASRGGDAGCRGGRPLAGWLSTGKGNRRLRRGSSGAGGSADGARGPTFFSFIVGPTCL
ncbi:hypothetical protein BHE74_00039305 [Ensete ventricosum]|nr:hypothetical protein BHE74_00039305 [Ensete ventricosum]